MVRLAFTTLVLALSALAAPVDEKRDGGGDGIIAITSSGDVTYGWIPDSTYESLAVDVKPVRRSLYKPSSKPITSDTNQAKYTLKTVNKWRKALKVPEVVWDDSQAAEAKRIATDGCTVDSPTSNYQFNVYSAGPKDSSKVDWLAGLRAMINWNHQSQGRDLHNNADSARKSILTYLWKSNTKIGCGYAFCDKDAPKNTMRAVFAYVTDQKIPPYGDGKAQTENFPNTKDVEWSKEY